MRESRLGHVTMALPGHSGVPDALGRVEPVRQLLLGDHVGRGVVLFAAGL